jgi:hypothetical protein
MQVFACGLIAKAHVLRGDRAAAATELGRAEETAARSAIISPWHQSTYLLGRLLFDATALEECQAGDRRGLAAAGKAARRSARAATRMVKKIAKERVETYQLAGRVEWLLGKPKAACVWWTRSIAAGEAMGARPELARTYLEVGRRLSQPGSHVRALGGVEAAEYLARAQRIFAELGLDWDLDQLGGAETAPSLAAARA